jgi:hypothetical protein
LAAGQAQLLDGVHLPDGVRQRGSGDGGAGFAAGRGGRLLQAGEVTLQGACAGQVGFGVALAQADAQVGRSPGRVLSVQQQGLLQRRAERGRLGPRGVGRLHRRGALVVQGLTKATHRAGVEVQLPGDEGGRVAALPVSEDALPHGEGKWCRHGTSMTIAVMTSCSSPYRHPKRTDKLLSQLPDKLVSRLPDKLTVA